MSLFSKGQPLPEGAEPEFVTPDGNPIGKDPPPPEARVEKPEPEEKPAERKKEPAVAKPKNKPRKPITSDNDERVLARARRMSRKQMRDVWEAMGFEGEFDEEAFREKLLEIKAGREEGLTSQQRMEAQVKKNEERIATLMAEKQVLQRQLTAAQREAQEAAAAFENHKAESSLMEAAREAGFKDPEYALHLLRKKIESLPEDQDPEDGFVEKFFGELRKDSSKRSLFHEEQVPAAPRSIAHQPTQGAPQVQPNRVTPTPPPPGGDQPKPTSVLDMKPEEFKQYSAEKYGYVPGQA